MVRRLREVHQAAALLGAGMPDAKVGEALKGPPWATKKVIARAKKADVATLERAICVFADLEVELRGGGDLRWTRTRRSRWRSPARRARRRRCHRPRPMLSGRVKIWSGLPS